MRDLEISDEPGAEGGGDVPEAREDRPSLTAPVIVPRLELLRLAFPLGHHVNYVRDVSSPEWAISVELSRWLWHFMDERQVKSAIDLGSGFTSFLLREHPSTNRVLSLDNDPIWREKNQKWLNAYYPDSQIALRTVAGLAKTLKAKKQRGVDLVVLDTGPDREDSIPLAAGMLNKGGVLVLDDIHRYIYRAFCNCWAETNGWKMTLLEEETRDEFGRYAAYLERKHDGRTEKSPKMGRIPPAKG